MLAEKNHLITLHVGNLTRMIINFYIEFKNKLKLEFISFNGKPIVSSLFCLAHVIGISKMYMLSLRSEVFMKILLN